MTDTEIQPGMRIRCKDGKLYRVISVDGDYLFVRRSRGSFAYYIGRYAVAEVETVKGWVAA